MYKIKPIVTAISLATATSLSPVIAQENSNDKTVKKSEIEVISVMATKRSQSIQEVPISVVAFSGEDMIKSGIEEVADLGAFTPNLYVSKSSMQVSQTIGIRGVGTSSNAALEPSVATYIDGVYMPRPGALLGSFTDIEMVEVLRGPQGTLFGRNASIGVVNIRSKSPELGENYADISMGVGNYGALDTAITANASLTNNVAVRGNLNYSADDGYGENLYDGNENLGEKDSSLGRLSFLYQASDDFNALVKFDYQELNGTGSPVEVLPESATPERLQVLNYLGAVPDLSGIDGFVNQIHDDSMESSQWGTMLEMNWNNLFTDYSIKSITSFRDWSNNTLEGDITRLPLDLAARQSDYSSRSFSQELQFISPIGETYDYIAGVYFSKEDYSIDQTFHLGAAFCPVGVGASLAGMPPALIQGTIAACLAMPQENATPAAFSQTTESLAAFYQGTWHLTDKLDITAGIRYTDDSKSADMVVAPTNLVAGTLLAGKEDHKLSFDDSQATWLLNGKYQLDQDLMLFATASTGFKSGGFNSVMTQGGLTAQERTIDSEEVTNYEFGARSMLFDGIMTANATLYRTEIENFQDRSFKGLTFITSNVGTLRQQGLELEMNLYLTDELTMRASYAYLDSAFLDYKDATNLPGIPGPQDLTGTPNNRSPKHQLSAFAEYADTFSSANLGWYARIESNWQDDTNVGSTTNNNPQDIQKALALTNIRFGLLGSDEEWSVQLYAENVTDESYCQNTFNQPFGDQFGTVSNGGTLIRCVMGAPRTFGLRASYHFE